MYLVMLAYSLLMKQLKQPAAKAWALKWLTTIGQACRAVANETLRTTHPRLGHETNQRKFPGNSTRLGSIGVDLTFCKSPVFNYDFSANFCTT